MVTYTVRYRKIGGLFWRKVRRVKGDGFVYSEAMVPEGQDERGRPRFRKSVAQFPFRYFITADEGRVEVPSDQVEFRFSRERFLRTTEIMSLEAGQPMQPDPR